ncbi:hypothetical protein OF83DRAFT_1182403 [Amylostereum chailletii]|nr:hypothetical protein OF83DRAFT_1182403 [Amylostereum chailletii]
MGKDSIHDLLNSDIQDPTDFPPQACAPGLRDLDGAFRCNICSELYEAPVSLPCGHSFCSLCVRQQLGEKAACPTCWKEASEGSLRINSALGEAIEAWKLARHGVLSYKIAQARQTKLKCDSGSNTRAGKKRKRASTPSSSSDIEEIPAKTGSATARKRPPTSSVKVGQPGSINDGEGFEDNEPIACPVCHKNVRIDRINEHLDSGCKTPTLSENAKQKDAWNKIFDAKTKGKGKDSRTNGGDDDDNYIPKVSYAVLKDKQLRDLLSEHELPSTGDRHVLIARHQRWVALYNANVDRGARQRKKPPELRAEMKKWERERDAGAKKATAREVAMQVNVDEYRANKAEFDALVAAARPKALERPVSARNLISKSQSRRSGTPDPGEAMAVDSDSG